MYRNTSSILCVQYTLNNLVVRQKKKKLLNEFKFVPLNKLPQTFWAIRIWIVKTLTGFCFLIKLINVQLLRFYYLVFVHCNELPSEYLYRN